MVPCGEVGDDPAKEIFQRRGRGIVADKDETLPFVHPKPVERKIVFFDLRKIPARGDVVQPPVQCPAEGVERTGNPHHCTFARAQLHAAVRAAVVEGVEPAGFIACHQDRSQRAFIDQEIARLGHFLDPPGKIPDPRPHRFAFTRGKARIDISAPRHAMAIDPGRGDILENIKRRHFVGRDDCTIGGCACTRSAHGDRLFSSRHGFSPACSAATRRAGSCQTPCGAGFQPDRFGAAPCIRRSGS